MIFYLAAANFLLGAHDCWLTARRVKEYGSRVETTKSVRGLTTLLGPQFGSLLGVLIPSVVWTIILTLLDAPIALALLVGWNLKRFDRQLASLEFEKQHKKNMPAMIDAYNKLAGGEATLPSDSQESKPPASSSWKDYTPTDCK